MLRILENTTMYIKSILTTPTNTFFYGAKREIKPHISRKLSMRVVITAVTKLGSYEVGMAEGTSAILKTEDIRE